MTLIAAIALLLGQDAEGAALVKKAVETTRAQKSFETAFKARYAPFKGDVLDYQGRQVWVAPGVLYMALTGSGQLDKKIVRAGAKVWVHHEVHGWLDAAENGDDAAGRGIQHPLEILEIVGRQAESAVGTKTGATIRLTGAALKAALQHHVQGNAVAWDQSTAQVDLTVDAEGRLKSLTCNATLQSNAPAAPGKIGYSMEVSLVGWNAVGDLKFTDSQSRPIPLTAPMRDLITAVKEGKSP